MRFLFLLSLLLFVFVPSVASALKISPFRLQITAAGIGKSHVIRIENNAPESAAVQVSVTTWEMAQDGSEVNQDAEADFAVFPAQVVLGPHESRAVRVQYLGAPPEGAEKTYRLVAEQLPVRLKDTPPAGSAVRFLVRFKAALYVSPSGAKSDVHVTQMERLADGKIALVLANRGTRHALLKNPRLTIARGQGGEILLKGESLQSMEGENIHAGATRQFFVAVPQDMGGGISGVVLDFDGAS